MNMLLHGVKDTEFEIFHGDSLTNEWDMLRELNPAKQPSFDAGIPVCILVLKKCKKYDVVLFINAAEHFIQGERQNQLTKEHIDKIVETYQFRKEEDRYSKCIGMERIAVEGFNLNISRYISTAVSEVEIDLASTHGELFGIAEAIREATAKHDKFLIELGLPELP